MKIMHLRARRGMSMMIVAVTLMVVAVMAVVTMPNLVTYQKQQDAEYMAKNMLSLDTTLGRWLTFIGQLPQQLHVLNLPLSTSDSTCGGSLFKSKPVNQWSGFWPWTGVIIIPDEGVPTPLGFIHDTLARSTVISGDAEMHVDSLDLDSVQLLDIAIDGADDPAAGSLRYEASSASTAAHPLYLARFQVHLGNKATSGAGCF